MSPIAVDQPNGRAASPSLKRGEAGGTIEAGSDAELSADVSACEAATLPTLAGTSSASATRIHTHSDRGI